MAKKKKDDYGLSEVTRVPLEPKMLFMVMDKSSSFYGVNFRVISITEGNPDPLEPIDALIKFQKQTPRGPGKPGEQHKSCPDCGSQWGGRGSLVIAATRETPTQNEIATLPESAFWDTLAEHGATLVEP